jgi:hypothetical protein
LSGRDAATKPAAEIGETKTVDAGTRPRSAPLVLICWIALLVMPAATVFSSSHEWDVDQLPLFLTSCWLLLGLRVIFSGRLFFIVTYPIACLGVACVAADFARDVDLLELVSQWRTFSALDIKSALGPYVTPGAIGALLLAGIARMGCRPGGGGIHGSPRKRWLQVSFAILGVSLALVVPGEAWIRAWPANAVLVAVATSTNSHFLAPHLFAYTLDFNPRERTATWNASLSIAPTEPATFVFVIGETLRSDFLHECGGPAGVRAVATGALVACDVTSGSDATHTSVPLLVSREMPGHSARVSSDATFLRAFSEVGFETYWYTDQELSIAWPDAQHQQRINLESSDRAALLPPMTAALAGERPFKALVIHAYNAHAPYCAHYDAERAPYRVSCNDSAAEPDRRTIDRRRLQYANAVDESIDFLNELIALLEKQPGQVFLVFTPDHGENLLDDHRGLYEHALRHPTRWDIRVPAVFWANESWQCAHPQEWMKLRRNIDGPMMHADMVPTLLGAAGIHYEEPRELVVNLLRDEVPHRTRIVQRSLGATTDWDTLVKEAR